MKSVMTWCFGVFPPDLVITVHVTCDSCPVICRVPTENLENITQDCCTITDDYCTMTNGLPSVLQYAYRSCSRIANHLSNPAMLRCI